MRVLLVMAMISAALCGKCSVVEVVDISNPTPEDIGFVRLEVIRRDGVSGVSTVEYFTEEAEAFAGLDFVPESGTLTFNAGETNKFVRIKILLDNLRETVDESFFFHLRNPSEGTILGNRTRVSILISDRSADPHPVGEVRVGESDRKVTVFVRRGGPPEALPRIVLNFRTVDGTATAGADFIGIAGSAAMEAGVSEISVEIDILNDGQREGDHYFFLETSTSSGMTASAMVRIVDDDPGFSVGVSGGAADTFYMEGREWEGEVLVPILRGSNGDETVSVGYSTESRSAVEGADFEGTVGRLEFAPGEMQRNIRIKLINDVIVDGFKQLELRLFEPSAGARIGSPTNAVINLVDNDAGVQFEGVPPQADMIYFVFGENQGRAGLKVVNLSYPLLETTITYSLKAGSAEAGKDFKEVTGSVTIPAGVAGVEIPVEVLDDALLEGDETFTVRLESSSPTPLGAYVNSTVVLTDVEPVSAIDYDFTRRVIAHSEVDRIVVQPNGQILIAAWFLNVDGIETTELCRLNPDGSLDKSFGGRGWVQLWRRTSHSSPWGDLLVDGKGRIVIAGQFSGAEGISRKGLIRLTKEGFVDESFNSQFEGIATRATVLPDDSVVFLTQPGLGLRKAREDGTIDSAFQAPTLQALGSVELHTDALGGILVHNAWIGTQQRPGHWLILRLFADGKTDPAFVPPSGDKMVQDIVVEATGKLLVLADGQLFRLDANGKLERDFGVANVNTIARQPDGRILVARGLHVERLSRDGTLDRSFGPVRLEGLIEYIATLATTLDGGVLAGGWFTTYDGRLRKIIRIHGGPVAGIADINLNSSGVLEIAVTGSATYNYILEKTTDFRTWSSAGSMQAESTGVHFSVPVQEAEESAFFRVSVTE